MDIKGAKGGVNGLSSAFSNAVSLSTSPEFGRSPEYLRSFPGSGGERRRRDTNTGAKPLKPFDTQAIKILLLENVNTAGQDILRAQGYQVEALKASLPEAELIEKIRHVC